VSRISGWIRNGPRASHRCVDGGEDGDDDDIDEMITRNLVTSIVIMDRHRKQQQQLTHGMCVVVQDARYYSEELMRADLPKALHLT
jgi:hypothetical protein